jgi:hypothetical protein
MSGIDNISNAIDSRVTPQMRCSLRHVTLLLYRREVAILANSETLVEEIINDRKFIFNACY